MDNVPKNQLDLGMFILLIIFDHFYHIFSLTFFSLTFFFLIILIIIRFTQIKEGNCGDVDGRMTVETIAACVNAVTLLSITLPTTDKLGRSNYNLPLKLEGADKSVTAKDAAICSDNVCEKDSGTALPSGCLVVNKNTNPEFYQTTNGDYIKFGEEGYVKDLIVNKNSKSKPKCSSESACICWSGSACVYDAGKQPNEVSCSCGIDICDYTNPFCTKSSISNKGFCSPTLQCKDKNI